MRGDGGVKDRMRSFYSAFIGPGDLAFDIGANHGDRVETFLSLGAGVVAVEPQRHCLDDLQRKFGQRADVVIVDAAVDRQPGTATMYLSNNDMVSSLNVKWISRVRSGGRFDDSIWEEHVDVRTMTLDDLIEAYGLPAFIKIDVEGNELRALEGLSVPVRALSFEYTPEDIEAAVRCVERLQKLGNYRYDLSSGETFTMNIGRFVTADQVIDSLVSLAARDDEPSGDVYAVLADSG
ncbi:hypothetical protein AOA80_01980 [Methanomassiliicoccales archaeon RumEn M1]|jgi:FkbM family methyltransferase|nr:hypothetical protein AOA80_01980 [Methanomassiliicoccales archaeon RumEn M1]